MLLQYCSLQSNPVVTLQRQLDPEYTDFGTVRVNSMECQLVNLFSTLEDKVCSIISKNIPSVTKVLSVIGSFKQLSVQFSSVQSLWTIGSSGDTTDDSAEVFFQAIMSSVIVSGDHSDTAHRRLFMVKVISCYRHISARLLSKKLEEMNYCSCCC